MIERMGHAWRVAATGLCFITFGAGGLLLSLTMVPFIYLVSPGRELKQHRVQRLIHYCFKGFVGMMVMLRIFTLEVKGYEKVKDRENLLVIANHPSLIDVVFIISYFPVIGCIVKKDLWRNPFLWGVVHFAGYIANNAPETILSDSVSFLKKGGSLVIFPEGSRTRIPAQKLQRGAANIALRSGCNLTPIIIRCNPPMLSKHQRWYHAPLQRSHFRIEFREDIGVAQFAKEADNYPVASRRLTQHIEQCFKMGAQ